MPCPFCALLPQDALVFESPRVLAFRDRYPVSPGHTLVITRRHAATYFDTTPEERTALWSAVETIQAQLRELDPKPDGFNVGFNAGEAAGQTVMHVHVHVIPRYRGDMDDPRGGVRHVIPSKGNYVAQVSPLATGGHDDPFRRANCESPSSPPSLSSPGSTASRPPSTPRSLAPPPCAC